jgi:4-amino-4-deoxychorismate lyase
LIDVDASLLEMYFQKLLASVAQQPDFRFGSVKIMVSRGDSLRGYMHPAQLDCNYYCLAFPGNELCQGDKRLCLSDVRLARQPLLAGLKHANRMEQVLARQNLPGSFDEAIMLDTQGCLVEGISSNIFFRLGQRWLTPKLDQAGVAGVARQLLLKKIMPEAGLDVREGVFGLNDIVEAEQLFISSSLRGVQHIKQLVITGRQRADASAAKDSELNRCYAQCPEVAILQNNFFNNFVQTSLSSPIGESFF